MWLTALRVILFCPALCCEESWPLLLNQCLQLVQVSLLDLYAPEIPLPDNLRILFVLNEKVTSANAVIVRADEDLSLSTLLEQPLPEKPAV